jgi:ribosome-binding factor A
MKNVAPKKESNRIAKVNSLLQILLGRILLPYIKAMNGLVTVSKIECSRDLKYAKVWISIVGGEDTAIMNTLKNNIYDIQGQLNREMEVKIVPRIAFFLDTSGRYAAHINDIFKIIEEEHDRPE